MLACSMAEQVKVDVPNFTLDLSGFTQTSPGRTSALQRWVAAIPLRKKKPREWGLNFIFSRALQVRKPSPDRMLQSLVAMFLQVRHERRSARADVGRIILAGLALLVDIARGIF